MEERPFNHASFLAYLNEGRLMGSRCMSCGAVYLPPQRLCARCFASQMTWQGFSGEGSLSGFTCIHVGLPEMAAQGYSREHPYCSGVVRLAEGPAISGQIVGVDAARPGTIHIGMPLRAVFLNNGGTVRLGFQPPDSHGID